MRGVKTTPATSVPREMLLGRLEEALDRPATNAERELMLWLCPPAAELRRLPAARGLLATPWEGVDRADGAEVGFLTIGPEGAIAVSVDSRVHVAPGPYLDFRDGIAATLAKLVAVGVRPLALHTVVHGRVPEKEAERGGLRAAIEGVSTYARGEGVATLGAELCFDAEYGDTLVVDSVAIGWCDANAMQIAARAPEEGDQLLQPRREDEIAVALVMAEGKGCLRREFHAPSGCGAAPRGGDATRGA